MMKLLSAIAVICVFMVIARLNNSLIERIGASKQVSQYRTKYITRTINLGLVLICVMLLFLVLGIEYAQVSVFLSSVFAVIGVALFAQWSILSNVTASMIIFFGFPYRVGDYIRVLEKDENVSGVIDEISLFHVMIKVDEKIITYPNTLILQRPVIKYANESAMRDD